MLSKSRFLVLSIGIVSLAFAAIANRAESKEYGPFVVKLSDIDNMTFTFNRKLEKPTQALDLAARDGGGITLTDGLLTLKNDVTIDVPVIDPTTNLPQVGADGKPVTNPVLYPAGTVLDPTRKPADNILLPKDVTVSAVAIANGKYSIGRFGYVGVAPRFDSKNLEMFASKMGHSLRVKAWITQDILDTYEFTLLSRFKSYSDMLAKPTIHLETLQDIRQLAANASSADMRKWYSVASYYSKHLYENATMDIYKTPSSDDEYKRLILTHMIQTYLNDPSETVEGGLALFNKYKADPTFMLTRREASAALFRAQFKKIFVEGPAVAPIYPILPLVTPSPLPSGAPVPIPSPTPIPSPFPHANALGYLTFVYPIAIDKEGPFKLPSPGLRRFPLASSIEGRWFSNRWLGEFGGFPFLQITEDGVAFHGPITLANDGSTWFLRRDNVSHSCMRMDPSDLMELRALIPRNMNSLQRLNQTIPLWITEWPDVTDLDNNGTNEVVDVAYYSIPTNGSQISNVLNWRPSVYNKSYWSKMFSPYVKRLKSKNAFHLTTTTMNDPETGGMKTVNGAVFTGLPKYGVVDGVLRPVGYFSEPLPIKTMDQRPGQIIQYREDGTIYQGADDDGADRWGSYPPAVVNKF